MIEALETDLVAGLVLVAAFSATALGSTMMLAGAAARRRLARQRA